MSWITGKEILERPGWGLKAELSNAFKAGLRPFREADGAMLTARIERDGKALDMGSRCFHCVHGSEGRGYMATGCPRNDAGQSIDLIIRKIVKPGIEELRGKVDKALFREGLPSNVFDFPGYSADADFVQHVEDQVGPGNLRAMLIESRCRHQEPADQNEVCNRLLAAKFRLKDVEAFEDRHGIGQDGTGQGKGQHQESGKTPLHFACAEDLVAYHRGLKVHEFHELARLVDAYFTETARLTDIELGALLPAKGTEASKPEGCRSQGKRLRKRYATSK